MESSVLPEVGLFLWVGVRSLVAKKLAALATEKSLPFPKKDIVELRKNSVKYNFIRLLRFLCTGTKEFCS